MLSQEIEERLAERFANRINEFNNIILDEIGKNIKAFSRINISQARQLQQMLKYGGSYNEIVKKLSKISGKSIDEIYKMFDEIAKSNKEFAEQFYKYRGIDFIPYSKDIALQNQVNSLARITANTFSNISRTSSIGYVLTDLRGNKTFKNIEQTYADLIDRSVIALAQGKTTFESEMKRTIRELGNGLVVFESGRTRRLDSVVRMNIQDSIRQLNIENSMRFGQEYNADGIEISVHTAPAPDHADIQGRQFTLDEYNKLEAGELAQDVKGNVYDGADKRQIGTLNCYHKTFNIVIGASEPEYSDKELKKIQQDNKNGFEFEGNHYTLYEGTQLQRRIETAIRKQKDTKRLADASGYDDLVQECNSKIKRLTLKYNELCNASGLKSKKQRMRIY